MKARQKQNGVLALAEVPEPIPAADPLVVEVRAISLNCGEGRGVARTLFSKGAATMRELEKREYPGKAVREVDGRHRAGVRVFKRAEP